jgi:poly(A) polymerase
MTLDPVGQLAPQDWMEAPWTKRVIAALRAEGADVRFVGGCVRDAVLKRAIKDVDIATHDPPERVMLLLEQAGIKAVPTGIEHGTVTAVTSSHHFEITTLRCDVETFGRKARVEFTDDWAADAARRDFTINALFADPDGRIYDPFDGLLDLGAGRIRFVGDPRQRLEEDVLRLLRFFRFYAHYGKPPPDAGSLAACRIMAPNLPRLSGERVCGEFIKLLQATDPASVLLLMHGERILDHVLPEAQEFGRLRVLCFLEARGLRMDSVQPDPLRRLAATLRTDKAGAMAVAERLKLSIRQRDRLVALAAPAVLPQPSWSGPERRRLLRKVGGDIFRDLVLIAWAQHKSIEAHGSSAETQAWIGLINDADGWVPVDLPVKGRDALALGVPHGPAVGNLMAAIEQWWEAEDYRPDREACLAKMKEMAAQATGA